GERAARRRPPRRGPAAREGSSRPRAPGARSRRPGDRFEGAAGLDPVVEGRGAPLAVEQRLVLRSAAEDEDRVAGGGAANREVDGVAPLQYDVAGDARGPAGTLLEARGEPLAGLEGSPALGGEDNRVRQLG